MKLIVAGLPQLGMKMGLGRADFLAQVKHGPGEHQSQVCKAEFEKQSATMLRLYNWQNWVTERWGVIPPDKSQNSYEDLHFLICLTMLVFFFCSSVIVFC